MEKKGKLGRPRKDIQIETDPKNEEYWNQKSARVFQKIYDESGIDDYSVLTDLISDVGIETSYNTVSKFPKRGILRFGVFMRFCKALGWNIILRKGDQEINLDEL